ncbi:MAG: hypothetical protein AAB788_03575, partial [Patescibacteria group bacterium]
SNYISDVSKIHWMVSNPARITRTGMDGKPFRCPFCSGNEVDTPPEAYRLGEGEANKPGWSVRVFANLFPITELHEVVVHSPDHEKNIEDFSLVQVENILKTYISRFNLLKSKGKVFIFHNYALISGASLAHPHSQITVVPNDVPTDTISVQPIINIIEQNDDFVSYSPEYSEWSYEVWIKALGQNKFENLNDSEIKNLAVILQSTILKLKKVHDENPHYSKKPFGYNFYIQPYGNWFLRIIPRFMERAGFELSTGIMVNSVEAKKASEELKIA